MRLFIVSLGIALFSTCALNQNIETPAWTLPKTISGATPLRLDYEVEGSLVKKVFLDLYCLDTYGSISLYANNKLIADNLNIPDSRQQTLNSLVQFENTGEVELRIQVRDATIVLNRIWFEEVSGLNIPAYEDITHSAGVDQVSSIKYGGPTIADIDQDGDYDFIVNNHNAESSKLYWNNGDGTVTKHDRNLARWFMHDLHGTAAGDYDNDGDLDLVVCQGGGNGTNPSKANFYRNDDGTLIRFTGDVGIDRGGRGRAARWSDFDLDGDLDLLLVNETGLMQEKPQHFFYENNGDGTFQFREVPGLQDVHQSRVLITDINNDHIDDIILYGPLSIWIGNGDFTFRDITQTALPNLPEYRGVNAVADIDIYNDGDLDLYLARGKAFEGGQGESPSLDIDLPNQKMSIKTRGYEGVDTFEFEAEGTVKLHDYYYLAQGIYRGRTYPIILGEKPRGTLVESGEEFEFDQSMAIGFPDTFATSGLYIGYLGNNRWRAALVRKRDIFWSYNFSLSGVTSVIPAFQPQNRNEQDILLRNRDGVFTDISGDWNLPTGGNALGVTVGDFNNDSYQDIFVYRWGFIGNRSSDLMLLNTGQNHFETVSIHGANDIGGPGNGDMGQAFDFDLDGDLDLLNGSENGEWYLYGNSSANRLGNHLIVKVGYAPVSNVDAISAVVIVKAGGAEYRKRVGSSGEVFSQSLLNMVHFGLGETDKVESVQVRWRNGEVTVVQAPPINSTIDTDSVPPEEMEVISPAVELRAGTSFCLSTQVQPINANRQIQWSSSNESVLQVEEDGLVRAIGQVGQSATITATSRAPNHLSASLELTIIDWYALPIETLELQHDTLQMVEQKQTQLPTRISPRYADDQRLSWTSSNQQIATVDDQGVVTALKPGEVTIQVTSQANEQLEDHLHLVVEPLIAPYARMLNKEELEQLTLGDSITVQAEYHAGTGHTVISADEGGVRFWLRHFKNEWIPIRDVVLVDESALGTVSGTVTKTFSLADYIPTAELPERQFYQLRVTFTSSDGNMYQDQLYPLDLVSR